MLVAELQRAREWWAAAQREYKADHRMLVDYANVSDAWLAEFYGQSRLVLSEEGQYPANLLDCETVLRGRKIRYIQVWKSNTQGICGNLRRMDDGSTPRPELAPFTFTFVREPLSHYISGFSERASRSKSDGGPPDMDRCAPIAFDASLSAEEQAAAYLEDTLFGRIHRCSPDMGFWDDLHVYPQARCSCALNARNGAPFLFKPARLPSGALQLRPEGWQTALLDLFFELTVRLLSMTSETA